MYEIDTDSASSLAQSASARRASLNTAAIQARNLLSSVGMSSAAPSLIEQIAEHVQAIGQEFGAAAGRAIAADVFTLPPGPFDRPSIPALDAAARSQAEAIAEAEAHAEWLLGLSENGADYETRVAKVDEIAAFLEENADNPEVTAAFFATLGANGTMDVPEDLVQIMYNASRSDTSQRVLDDGGSLTDDIIAAQERFMNAFGAALGNASTAGVLPPDFADQMVNQVTSGSQTEGWALSEILSRGTFSAPFLGTIADGLDEFERERGRPGMWRDRVPQDPSSPIYVLGTERDQQYFDPFVGLFEALGRTPDAALDFLYPDGAVGPGESERATYYINERTWSHDDFNALGEMLEGASLAHRTAGDPRSELSALAATDTINLLGTRPGDQKIGDSAYDSLGNIVSNYIYDVDAAFTFVAATGNAAWLEDTPEFANLPPGAQFERDALQRVLSETLTDDAALEQVLDAVAVLNSTRISAVAGTLDPASPARLDTAIMLNSNLVGTIVGAAGYGSIADAERDAARGELINGALHDAAKLIPIPGGGSFADFVAGKVIDQIEIAPTDQVNAAKDDAWDLQTTATLGSLHNIGAQLGEAGLLDVRETPGSKPYTWFDPIYMGPQVVGYEFNAATALHPDNIDSFQISLYNDPTWGSSLRGVEGYVNDGINEGMRGFFD